MPHPAVAHIRDALRYIEICVAAIKSDYTDVRDEIQKTLGSDAERALHEALEALDGGAS